MDTKSSAPTPWPVISMGTNYQYYKELADEEARIVTFSKTWAKKKVQEIAQGTEGTPQLYDKLLGTIVHLASIIERMERDAARPGA